MGDAMGDAKVTEGKRAPAFSGKTNGGGKIALKDHKGRTLVVFWYPKAMTPG